MKHPTIAFAAGITSLKTADWITTLIGLSRGAIEANPLFSPFLFIMTCMLVIVASWFCHWLIKNKMTRAALVMCIGVVVMFTIPVVNNSIVLFML